MGNAALLIAVGIIMFSFFGIITIASHIYNLNSIKSKTVGDRQHGSARFASKGEIRKTYPRHIKYTPDIWREKTTDLKLPQSVIVKCKDKGKNTVAIVSYNNDRRRRLR